MFIKVRGRYGLSMRDDSDFIINTDTIISVDIQKKAVLVIGAQTIFIVSSGFEQLVKALDVKDNSL